MKDKIRPEHYKTPNGLQVWDVVTILELDFFCGNALKYMARCGKKESEDPIDDINKAIAYLEKKKQTLQSEKLNLTDK